LIETDMPTTYQTRRCEAGYVPLLYRGEAIGVITLDSGRPAFMAEEAQIARAFANQVAVAIENARLYDREFRRAETLQALLAVEQELTHNITAQSKSCWLKLPVPPAK
jgi:GAF domain-containing protein